EYLENSSNAMTPDLPTKEPDNSLSMGNEHLDTIPEIESDKVIKSSVEDLVPIPSESEGISDDTCDVPFFDNSPILDVLNDHCELFFDFNDDCTSDDESLSNEDVPEENVKIYSNPLFEFDDEYISSDVNPLFDEVLEDVECKNSYDFNLDELTFLVTPLSNSNEDKYFTPGDDVELLLHRDPSTPMMSVVSIHEGLTDEPPLEGFTQTYGVDYEETLSPVVDIRAIRILIAIVAYYDYDIWQMDVKTAFLNGHLFEKVYMEQPEGFVNPKY
nr:putative zinc finger, CCHC-type [Tanacetum cinerariifolium]